MSADAKIPKWPFPVLLIFAATVWELVTWNEWLPSYLLPSLQSVFLTLFSDFDILLKHFSTSILEWFIGLNAALVLSFLLCAAAFFSQTWHAFVKPVLVVSQAVPYLVFAPLLLIWLGFGILPKIVLIVMTCTFPIAVVWLEGLLNARLRYGELIAVCRLSPLQGFCSVCLPASMPGFFAGLKVSVSYAFVSAVLAELMGSSSGLGVYLARAQSSYRTDRALACVMIIVLFSLISTYCVQCLQKRVLFWQRFETKN